MRNPKLSIATTVTLEGSSSHIGQVFHPLIATLGICTRSPSSYIMACFMITCAMWNFGICAVQML